MTRLSPSPRPTARRAFLAAALALPAVLSAPPAAAQLLARPFPPTALRGTLVVVDPPVATINGRAIQLAPGARIRGPENLIVLSAGLVGQPLAVHYTTDDDGNLRDVWILRPDELAKRPWPTTPEEAARWTFDPTAETWRR